MQNYMQYGLGFNAEILTDEEFEALSESSQSSKSEINVEIISFTEGNEGKDWATVVVQNFGKLGVAGKFVTYDKLQKLFSSKALELKINKEKIKNELEKHNLGHYLDKVELIVYNECY